MNKGSKDTIWRLKEEFKNGTREGTKEIHWDKDAENSWTKGRR